LEDHIAVIRYVAHVEFVSGTAFAAISYLAAALYRLASESAWEAAKDYLFVYVRPAETPEHARLFYTEFRG
jgi:hypothetical protein